MTLIDSHCHLLYDRMDPPGATMARAAEAGVRGALTINCRIEDEFPEILTVAREHRNIVCSLGTHPHESAGDREKAISEDRIVELARSDPNIVAIGETGLDYHYDFADRDSQHEVFRKHIRAAMRAEMPLVIHAREADDDIIRLLKEEGAGDTRLRGVLHSFSSTPWMAEEGLKLGFYLGFSGMVTFKKSDELRDIARNAPTDRLLVETDSPYLAPVPHRGKTNEPAFVVHVNRQVAELHGMTEAAMAEQTTANFLALFNRARAALDLS